MGATPITPNSLEDKATARDKAYLLAYPDVASFVRRAVLGEAQNIAPYIMVVRTPHFPPIRGIIPLSKLEDAPKTSKGALKQFGIKGRELGLIQQTEWENIEG